MQVYKVKRNQNIFDVAVSTHGSIEGIFDLLINNPDLSFHSQLKEDEEIYWDEEFIIYDSIVNTLQSEHIVPANGERHVYHKSTTASLRCVVYISPKEVSVSAILSCRPFFILIFLLCIKMKHYGFSRKSIWKNLETFP